MDTEKRPLQLKSRLSVPKNGFSGRKADLSAKKYFSRDLAFSFSTAHEQLFSPGVKRYSFQPMFKNIGEKPAFQKDGFCATFPAKFMNPVSGLRGVFFSAQKRR
jgi:hypothetical protein